MPPIFRVAINGRTGDIGGVIVDAKSMMRLRGTPAGDLPFSTCPPTYGSAPYYLHTKPRYFAPELQGLGTLKKSCHSISYHYVFSNCPCRDLVIIACSFVL